MGLIKNSRAPVIAGALLLILFFASRLVFLTKLPIFTDEAIYLRWAQIALNDPNWLFISLTDGKQPLFIWLVMAVMAFIKDPLFAGRLVSVFAGLFSMLGLFFLSKELFKSIKIGFLASLLYIIYPFALVYDRMALYDSLVGAFAIWGIYLVIRLVKAQSLGWAILLGLEVGLSNLNKSNFFLTIILSPLTLALLKWKDVTYIRKLKKPVILIFLSGIISLVIYSLLRISPFFYIINQKNAVFIYPFSEWITNPLQSVFGNLQALWGWFLNYTAFPLWLFIALAFFIDKKFLREKLVLLSWFVIPFVVLAFFGRVVYPRYVLFMALPLLPLAGYFLDGMYKLFRNKLIFAGAIVLFSILPLKSDFYILTDFSKASIPFTDKFQYAVGWPSGFGVKESVEFFESEAKKGPIFIGAEGTFGLLPMSYEIYLGKNSNVKTKGYWPITNQPPEDLIKLGDRQTVFFVFYQPCPACREVGEAPASWNLTKIKSYPREQANLTIYKF